MLVTIGAERDDNATQKSPKEASWVNEKTLKEQCKSCLKALGFTLSANLKIVGRILMNWGLGYSTSLKV